MRWVVIVFVIVLALVAIVALVGVLLPQSHVASTSRTFAHPAERVFAAIGDVKSYPSWRSDVREVTVLSEQPLRWREDGGNGKIEYERTVDEPPQRQVVVIASKDLPFGGSWIYELAPDGTGTRLTITEHGDVYNPIFRFMARFVFGHTKTMNDYLSALERHLGTT
ncbi:MAG TPA: SRPBCC family protein [Gemmatimonadaceae bacterium]|nr:SRPBCC family protein [Gemmatimonadaceae bacterium]